MPDHVFRYEYVVKTLARVNGKRIADKFRRYLRPSGPRLNSSLAALAAGDLFREFGVHEWTFFERACHISFSYERSELETTYTQHLICLRQTVFEAILYIRTSVAILLELQFALYCVLLRFIALDIYIFPWPTATRFCDLPTVVRSKTLIKILGSR